MDDEEIIYSGQKNYIIFLKIIIIFFGTKKAQKNIN